MILRFCLISLIFMGAVSAKPKVVTLVSGEKIIGEVMKASDKKTLHLKSKLLGTLQLPRSQVEAITDYEKVYKDDPFAAPAPPATVAKKEKAPVRADPKEKPKPEPEVSYEPELVDRLRTFKAPADWSGNLRLGINFSQGDRRWTETYARGKLEVDPKDSPNFYRYTGSYVYRESERSNGDEFKSTDKADASFIYRRTFYDDWFFQNSTSWRMDQIKGIDRELNESLGIGYKYKPNNKFEFLIGAGGGVEEFQTDRSDVEDGLRPAMNVFQEAVWKPFNRTSFVQKFNYYWNPEDSAEYNFVFTAAVRVRLTDLLGLEFSFNKNYDNIIIENRVRDDTQWRNAVVVYF